MGNKVRVGVAVGLASLATVGSFGAPAGADPASADLSVTVSHTPDSLQTAVDVTFTITAANAGPDTAEDVLSGIGFDYPLEVRSYDERCEPSFSNNSVVCELGDIASGASETVEIVARPYSSGLYTIPVAVSSPTADPTPGDRSTSDTVLITRGPTQGVRYINGIFPIILGRAPGADALEYWSDRWTTANRTYPQRLTPIPAGIIASQEYRAQRVRGSYLRILGRSADAPSVTYWTGRAAQGLSFERIDQLLIGSAEFATKNAGATTAAVFQAVLGRAPTASELSQWGSTKPATVAGALQRSTEGYDVIIKDRFQRTLGEDPDSFARYIWQVRLRNGYTPEQLWAQLLVSNEFLEDYPLTEEEYYEEGGPIYDFSDRAGDLDKALAETR